MLKILYFVILFSINGYIFAQNVNKDLKNIKQKIDNVNLKLQKKGDEKNLIGLQLKETNIEIKNITDQVAKIKDEQDKQLNDLKNMQQELSLLELNIQNTKANISRLLNSQYKLKQPLALVLMLEKKDPNAKVRGIEYLKYIQAANIKQIENLEQDRIKFLQQKELINNQINLLRNTLDTKRLLLIQLNKKKNIQIKQFQSVDSEIKSFYKELSKLKFNEVKLNSLIENLRKQQLQKSKQLTNKKIPISKNIINKTNLIKDNYKNNFANQQGKLDFPTNGVVTGFFGKPKDGKSIWGGIFIKSNYSNVRSVYNGQVIYAAYLSGYGNTVIIDNYDYYLTIYSGLSSIDVAIGEKVISGTRIGKTGFFPNVGEGLYFEIRYQSTRLNPLSWFK